jgi:dephospho-CoA kinase
VTSVVSDTMMSYVIINIVMFLNVQKDTPKSALTIETLEDVSLQHTVDTTMRNKMTSSKTVIRLSKSKRKYKILKRRKVILRCKKDINTQNKQIDDLIAKIEMLQLLVTSKDDEFENKTLHKVIEEKDFLISN